MRTYSLKITFLSLLTLGAIQFNAAAQTNASTPVDVGTVVNGFQDNFTNSTRNPAWMAVNGGKEDPYVQTNGVLRIYSPTNYENPNHLIYNPTNVSYDPAVQEVLIRIRSVAWNYFENSEADMLLGSALSCQPTNSDQPYGGYCFMFMDADGNAYMGDPEIGRTHGYQVRVLDDYQAWGPGFPFLWTTNQWYWMRLGSDGTTLSAKVWPDDGVTPEPTNAQLSWVENGRTGFAGITGSHTTGIEFEVDYFLLKSSGLPSITVNPTPNPLYFTSAPHDSTNAVGTSATFSITVSNLAPVTYQWMSAPSNSTSFTPILDATNSTYTTPALSAADNDSQYYVFVSEGSFSDSSQVATVTIDTTPPTLLSASSAGSATHVLLKFSKAVQVPANASGFSASGLTFSGVTQGVLQNELVLGSSPMTFGTAYTLQVSGVQDLAGNNLATTSLAINQALQMPFEFGTIVNGYQDYFNTPTLSSNWIPCPNDPALLAQFTQTNGLLSFVTDTNVAAYDPEHLLYEPTTLYDSSNQEVLARIRINSAYSPDAELRAGVAGLCNPNSTVGSPPVSDPGQGAEAVFDDWPFGFAYNGVLAIDLVDQEFANDVINIASDGQNPTNAIYVHFGEWYWIRVKCTTADTIAVKFWPADGVTSEPLTFPEVDTFGALTNGPLYAGICAASAGAVEAFDLDYILIEAAGLPAITATPPTVFSFGPYINITTQPVSLTAHPETDFTLTVAASGSASPTFQWQSAPPGSSTFTNIAGETSTNLTEALPISLSGTDYRVIVSVPGLNVTSAVATVVTGPPLLLSAQTLGSPTSVTLTFNRAVQTPGSASGFSLNDGATVSSVSAGLTSNVLILTTSTLSLANSYILTASGVQDYYGNTLTTTNIAVSFALYLPAEIGASVAGYLDTFTNSSLDPNWLPIGIDVESGDNLFVETGDGLLHVSSATNAFLANPNDLLYDGPAYDPAQQEVLLRLRVTAFAASTVSGSFYGNGLDSIGGAVVGANTLDYGTSGTNTSGGINWLLCDNEGLGYTGTEGLQAAFLNDWILWGTGASYNWNTNTWYWLREYQSGSTNSTTPNVFGKVWLADGTTPEPAAWQAAWFQPVRYGLAGIKASSINKIGEDTLFNFDVSYFLLKAAGLPTITVAPPASFTLIPPGSPLLQFTSALSAGTTNVVLQWTGSGTLQVAASLEGPWTDLVDPNGAFSPYTIPASAPVAFYRLRQ